MAKNQDGYGYRKGPRMIAYVPLDSTAADIAIGDMITDAGATANYFKEVDAGGERVRGVATGSVLSPSADGDKSVGIDLSNESVYEYPPDAGTVSYGLVGKAVQAGADGRSIDIDNSGGGTQSFMVTDVNTDRNTVYVRLREIATADSAS